MRMKRLWRWQCHHHSYQVGMRMKRLWRWQCHQSSSQLPGRNENEETETLLLSLIILVIIIVRWVVVHAFWQQTLGKQPHVYIVIQDLKQHMCTVIRIWNSHPGSETTHVYSHQDLEQSSRIWNNTCTVIRIWNNTCVHSHQEQDTTHCVHMVI